MPTKAVRAICRTHDAKCEGFVRNLNAVTGRCVMPDNLTVNLAVEPTALETDSLTREDI